MGYLDQFVASVSFNGEKVITFKQQNLWKTILYVLVFVIVTGAFQTFLSWEVAFEQLQETQLADGFHVTNETSLELIHVFTQYLTILFDLVFHFILISAIAYAGYKGYQTVGEVTYKEAWNVTAYGISAPILVRLVVRGMGLTLPMMTFAYWGGVMLFSMMCLKKVVNCEK